MMLSPIGIVLGISVAYGYKQFIQAYSYIVEPCATINKQDRINKIRHMHRLRYATHWQGYLKRPKYVQVPLKYNDMDIIAIQ